MNGYLLDTHAWLWMERRDASEVSRNFFAEAEEWQRLRQIFLSAISALEIALLVADGRIDLGTTVDHFLEDAVSNEGLQLLPLSTRILIESTRLPGEIHRDPSDRLLVATAREHGLTLITRDKTLLNYAKQGHLNARKP